MSWLRATWQEEQEFGQLFLWVPVCLAVGICLYFSIPIEPGWAAIWGLTALMGMAFIAFRRRPAPPIAISALCLVLAGLALAKAEAWLNDTAGLQRPVSTQIVGLVEAREVVGDGRLRYHVRMLNDAVRSPAIEGKALISARAAHEPVPVGAVIEGRAGLVPPSGPVRPGGYDFAFHAWFQEIGAYGFFYGAPARSSRTVALSMRMRVEQSVRRKREAIAARIRQTLPGSTGAIAAALVVADRAGIPDETEEALRASGLAHVLAISGLHMALIAGAVMTVLRALMALSTTLTLHYPIRKIAALAALLAVAIYLMLSGFSVSAQRAFIMLAVMLTAILFDRSAITMRNVAIAAIIIMVLSPSAVLGAGFQMSFAATAALVAVYGAWNRRRLIMSSNTMEDRGVIRAASIIAGGIAATAIIAGLATAPFAAYHFQRLAPGSLIGNMAAMPAMTFIVMPALLGSIILMPFGLEEPLLKLAARGIEWMVWIAEKVATIFDSGFTGLMSSHAFISLTAGLTILVLFRTRLRLAGLVPIVAGLGMAFFQPYPDLVISETGRLAALRGDGDWLAISRPDPDSFTLDQWIRAYRSDEILKPPPLEGHGIDEENLSDDDAIRLPKTVWSNVPPGQFACVEDFACIAIAGNDHRLAVIKDLRLVGWACDTVDIVVIPARINMQSCRSGATLFTGRTLAKTGSIALTFGRPESWERFDQLRDRLWKKNRASGREKETFWIETALGAYPRPWTENRFDGTDNKARVRTGINQ